MADLLEDKNHWVMRFEMERRMTNLDPVELEKVGRKAAALELEMVSELLSKGDYERALINLESARTVIGDLLVYLGNKED